MTLRLKRVSPESLRNEPRASVDAATLSTASEIIDDVRERGESALREHAERLGDLTPGAPLTLGREALEAALDATPRAEREALGRAARAIRMFGEAQHECLTPLDVGVVGGRAGHRLLPVQSVGAYAPGGRYPLPSSVLMTVIPARVAGVENVWLASPRPSRATLAAAALAGADGVLAVGGAQAIAAFTYGVGCPAVDLVVGPGNRFVTAAKKILVGEVGIDGLAGPSELVVIADETANPEWVAADLLGQAEHDTDARPILVATDEWIVAAVDRALETRCAELPTEATARLAVERNGFAVVVDDLPAAAEVADRLAPEHLQLCVQDPDALAERVRCYGALFVGQGSAEVFGDYGAGPNHVLPTGGGARFQAGLSVATFLRMATWLRLDEPEALVPQTAALARIEGLEGHARAAEVRSPRGGSAPDSGPPAEAARPTSA